MRDELDPTTTLEIPLSNNQTEMFLLIVMTIAIGMATIASALFLVLSICLSARRKRVIYLELPSPAYVLHEKPKDRPDAIWMA
ncbi:hypothetical protein AAVH_26042 [Aphelenchoides avenae]|nr:hypothetical protein AAVH_26042 [Aphelenchus avenae]